MANFKPHDLIESMNPESLRVHAPTSVVFLCGGKIGEETEAPVTLRDAFFRLTKLGALPDYEVVLAERANPLVVADAGYRDLLSFESDIAQLVALILLFAESPGSLAELGAFSAMKSVAPSMMAVIDDFYYNESSFIRQGPIAYLEKEHGDEWVLVLDRQEIGIDEGGGIAALDMKAFSQSVLPEVKRRLRIKPKWEKFDPGNSGHAILALIGLCQEYGALTLTEIRDYLKAFNVENARLQNFIYCAELFRWLKRVKKGNHTYYVATPGDAAVDYQLGPSATTKNRLRWRSDVRAYWMDHDKPRLRAIADVRSALESNA